MMSRQKHLFSASGQDGNSMVYLNEPTFIFGPCSAESKEQTLQTAKLIAENFPDAIFRAGIWKPRTRPGSFAGVGQTGLSWLKEVQSETGLRVATEVANASHVELCMKHDIDVLWIGARTTVSPFSVQEIADALKGTQIPVMVKNPVIPDVLLWIGAIERFLHAGLNDIAAIHRGFHLFENKPFRNSPNWEIPLELMAAMPEIPVVCDVSHICGDPVLFHEIAQKAIDLNMKGLLFEVHHHPEIALSDAAQQITPQRLREVIGQLVFRQSTTDNPEFSNRLAVLRSKIDQIDSEIIIQLSRRMNHIRQSGKYKKENNVTIFQLKRWEEILNKCIAEGIEGELEEPFIRLLYNCIHDESIRQQFEMMNRTD
jgi:chorismate mutase